MTMRMTHSTRSRTEIVRARRIERVTLPVAPADAPMMDLAPSLTEILATVRRSRVDAERALRRRERERDLAGRALELSIPPAIDEAGRASLRAAHAAASARVDAARYAFDRARAIEAAATVIVADATDDGSRRSRDIADGLFRFLALRQPA